MDDKNLLTNSGSALLKDSMWWLMVALRRKGLEDTPKTTRVNLYATGSRFSACGLAVHRKRSESRSSSLIETIRKAFSISPVSATRCCLNLSSMSKISCPNLGPLYRQSLREGPAVRADASYTILSLDVVLSCQTTPWWGR